MYLNYYSFDLLIDKFFKFVPHYHITTLPHYHITTLPHYHITTLPHISNENLIYYRLSYINFLSYFRMISA